MGSYRNPGLRLLRDQLIGYAPYQVRLAQLERAEEVLHEIDPQATYRYPDLCERITSYRSELYPDLVVTGEEALNDLSQLIEEMSASMDQPVESVGQEVWTLEDVCQRFQISEKTVSRWRLRGLPARRLRFGKRHRLAFLRRHVERFVQSHPALVQRATGFNHLEPAEREAIIQQARILAAKGMTLMQVVRRLAEQYGRAPETIRYTIHKHDQEFPQAAVFPDARPTLSDEQRRLIFAAYRRGETLQKLAEKWKRSVATMRRLIMEQRVLELVSKPIHYISSEEFELPDAEALILPDPQETVPLPNSKVSPPPGLPPYLKDLYEIPLLSPEEEYHLFRKMNFLKYRAERLRQQINPRRPRMQMLDELEQWLEQADQIRQRLIRCNLRLVVSIAKQHVRPDLSLFELISDGNVSLIKAVENFDYTRGFKFSTYATYVIRRNYARSIGQIVPQPGIILSSDAENELLDLRAETQPLEPETEETKQLVAGVLEKLEDRDRQIIIWRHGLDGQNAKTLEEIGMIMGITKERVRQLVERAHQRIREIIKSKKWDLSPED